MSKGRIDFRKGLHEVGDGVWAYLQPDGSWGFSNAGLFAGKGTSLLVDTLFDLRLTREMLEEMAPITSSSPIDALVNTHANGDHCWGNSLVPTRTEIYASVAAAREMEELPPAVLRQMLQADLGPDVNEFARKAFGQFRFDDVELRPPTKTFRQRLTLDVGGRKAELIDVGPAHTAGDVLVVLPDARVAFAGDILFIGGTPIIWAGPVGNWIAACDLLCEMDIDVIVPDHGPVTDAEGVRGMKRYLEFVRDETRRRFDAGMSARDAAYDIELGEYSEWGDSERIVANVVALYRELDPAHPASSPLELFGEMARYAKTRGRAAR